MFSWIVAPKLIKAPWFSTYCNRNVSFRKLIDSNFGRLCLAIFFVTWSQPTQLIITKKIIVVLLVIFIFWIFWTFNGRFSDAALDASVCKHHVTAVRPNAPLHQLSLWFCFSFSRVIRYWCKWSRRRLYSSSNNLLSIKSFGCLSKG